MSEQDMSELLNCPFCGSESAPHVTDSACECCIDFTVVCNALNGGCGASGRFEETIDGAIKAWNRRPQITVTKNESGQIVSVTRTDAEGKILEVIAESAPQAKLKPYMVFDIAKECGHPENINIYNFASAISARCGGEQTRERKDLNTNAESFRRAVDAMQKEIIRFAAKPNYLK